MFSDITAPQSTSNIMSINAITSPYSKKPKVRHSQQPTVFDHQTSASDQMTVDIPTMFRHLQNRSKEINKPNSLSTWSPPSLSEQASDSNSSCSSQSSPPTTPKDNWSSSMYNLPSHSDHSMYTKRVLETETLLRDFEEMEDQVNTNYLGHGKSSQGKKGDSLATRRARNKLASAKYRAKKQALTHAMQNRIMQLATQVIYLNDELSRRERKEQEVAGKFYILAKHLQEQAVLGNSGTHHDAVA